MAAQRERTLPGESPQLRRGGVGPRGGVLGSGQLDKARFDSALVQQPVALHELVAPLPELHRTVNAWKGWTQGRLLGDGIAGAGRICFIHTNQMASGLAAWNDIRRFRPLLLPPLIAGASMYYSI